MKRTKLMDRIMPIYTKGEEIFNMTSHIIGVALGIVVTVLCIVFSTIHHNAYAVVSSSIYGFTMIVLYTMSSLYHGLKKDSLSKRVFQVLDHCSIFLLIAGTYTPISLCLLRKYSTALGWTIFGIIWGMAILGIVFNAIDLKKYKKFSMICYLIMGWCVIVKANLFPSLLGFGGTLLLVGGGIVYTVGAILYGVGKKHKYMHSVFHICIFFGSLLHFLCILFYVI